MSTSMYAATLLVDPSMKAHSFATAEDLMTARPLELKPRAGLKTYDSEGDDVVNEVSGSSRHDYLAWKVREMCEQSGITDLEFLQGDENVPCHWKLSLGGEEGEDKDVGYGRVCGYWLEGAQISTAYAALSALLDWSRSNPDKFDDFDDAEILAAIAEGSETPFPKPRYARYGEDGDGSGYLFAYLGTARHVLGNALVAGKAVLHVAEILD